MMSKVDQVKPAFELGTFSTAEAAARAHDFKARCLVKKYSFLIL